MVGTVFVEFDFNVWFLELYLAREVELLVLDVEPTLYPHGLVVGLD